jgi:NAD(P)H-flavin reductase
MYCEIINISFINKEIFRLDVIWQASQSKPAIPKGGQFFMIKPKRSAVFLGRPIGVEQWQADTISFLIVRLGRGTRELASMKKGEEVELIGPLGNAWTDFLPPPEKNSGAKPIALVGGSAGFAPLNALLCEAPEYNFDLYVGFKNGFDSLEERDAFFGPVINTRNILIASEDGKTGQKGRIPDFLEPDNYAAVCACGPPLMLKAVAAKCIAKKVPCFISMESRMACGVGACLGCAIKTVNGNRRCCADGPIFKAEEVIFND